MTSKKLKNYLNTNTNIEIEHNFLESTADKSNYLNKNSQSKNDN